MNTAFTSLLIVEVAITAAAVGMFLWRSILDMKEDDHLVLDQAERHLVQEQASIRHRATMLSRYIKMVSVAWGVLAVVILGMWVVQGLQLI
jgi:hypothetical protein